MIARDRDIDLFSELERGGADAEELEDAGEGA